jgi:hypothetical protein
MAIYGGILPFVRPGGYRLIAGLVGAALLLGIVFVASAPATARSPSTRVKGHGTSVVKSEYISLPDCRSIFMRVLIARSVYESGESVKVLATVQNHGTATCTISGAVGSAHQYIGPCGAISMTVANSRGVSIWPGPIAPSCPSMGAVDLSPGQQIVATGTWPLTIGFSGFRPAPVGRHRIVIGSSIAFGVRITAARPGP